MSRSEQLRASSADLWEQAVRHPFVTELGAGTLPLDKFKRYFVQDYLFLDALRRVVGIAVAKAPNLEAARHLHEFLGVILGAEDALFLRAFEALGVPEREYRPAEPLPTTAAFSDFLIRLAYDGSFRETCTALYVTEAVYLDWAERLRAEDTSPGVTAYQEWVDIHSEEALGPFVSFLRGVVDEGPNDDATLGRLGTVFETSLRYEIRFWEMGYHGESWP